jgi:hypothetical protein
MKSRLIFVLAVVSAVVGMSVSTPDAHASPRAKTYKGTANFFTSPVPNNACFVFHSDGSFSFDLQGGPPPIATIGTFFELGDLWFSFSIGDVSRLFLFVGTTFDVQGTLAAVGIFTFTDYPAALPFLAFGHSISGPCDVSLTGTPEGSVQRPGNSR